MSQSCKMFSEIERYEIINLNDGEKYNSVSSNDLIIDTEGNLKMLLISNNYNRMSIFSSNEFMEVPWDNVKKIGARTIIIDMDPDDMKRAKA